MKPKQVTLSGNTRPEATPEHDRGKVPDDYPMEHMLLQLSVRRNKQALQQYLEELHTKGSPNFQRWLTAQEFGERFGEFQQQTSMRSCAGWKNMV